MPSIVDGKNRFGARRDPRRDLFGIKVQRVFENVGEDRRRALIEHAVRGGAKVSGEVMASSPVAVRRQKRPRAGQPCRN